MVSVQILRRRIRSIEGTAKICKAMEMIATAKMRRAQEQAIAGRPYAEEITRVVSDLAAEAQGEGRTHPLLQKRPVTRITVVHMTTDRGLCGGLNANQNRLLASFVLQQSVPVTIVALGRKGRAFVRSARLNLRAEFSGLGDRPSLQDSLPISRLLIDDYTNAQADLVYLAYPRFISTLVQRPTMEVLLPIEPAVLPRAQAREYIYEPSPEAVLNQLLPRYVEMKVYHAILELVASEQSARMVAMRNASNNAQDLIEDLRLMLNKVRQERITKEICDITGGAEALERGR